jgi:hypothetical protein
MSATVNNVTGEVTVELSGETFRLRASMGRVGDLEAQLGVDGFSGIQEQLSRISARVTPKAFKALCTSDNAAAIDELQYSQLAPALDAVWKALTAGLPDEKKSAQPVTEKKRNNGRHPGRAIEPLPLAD